MLWEVLAIANCMLLAVLLPCLISKTYLAVCLGAISALLLHAYRVVTGIHMFTVAEHASGSSLHTSTSDAVTVGATIE